jgi:hypothetical protein
MYSAASCKYTSARLPAALCLRQFLPLAPWSQVLTGSAAPPSPNDTRARSFVDMTKAEKDRLLQDIREAQQQIAEQVRMAQAAVHFQNDEAHLQVRQHRPKKRPPRCSAYGWLRVLSTTTVGRRRRHNSDVPVLKLPRAAQLVPWRCTFFCLPVDSHHATSHHCACACSSGRRQTWRRPGF